MHHRNSFYWGIDVGEFLFPGLNVNGTINLIILCIVLVFFTVLYEGIKVHQTRSRSRAARERLKKQICPGSETARLLAASLQGLNSRQLFFRKFFKITKQALIFLSHNTLGYVLMLTVMVYNAYVFIAVILGLGLGYFLFGHISMKVNMENIRARTTYTVCSPNCGSGPSASGSQTSSQQGVYINEGISSSDNNSVCDTQSTQSTAQITNVEVHELTSEPNSKLEVIHSCHL